MNDNPPVMVVSRRRVLRIGFALLLSTALHLPGIARAAADSAQPPRRVELMLVGFSPTSPEVQKFRQGLSDAGYVEGRDVIVSVRSAEGNYEAVRPMVAELVRSKPDLIVVENTLAVRAVKDATTTIPVVIAIAADPLGSGLVPNLSRPGGNVTGMSMMITDLAAKRFQLLKEAMPHLKRLGILRDPAVPWHPKTSAQLASLAQANGIEPIMADAHTSSETRKAISYLAKRRAQALYVLDNALFYRNRAEILQLCAKARIAAIYGYRDWAQEGALLSYSADFGEMFRRAAGYADRILKGSNAGELPIEQPTKFDLVVNLRTAKALGVRVPESIMVQATEVIR